MRAQLAVVQIFCAAWVQGQVVMSPDGEISLSVSTNDGRLTYCVEAFGKTVLTDSAIELRVEGWDAFGPQVEIVDVSQCSSNTAWKPVVPGRRSTIRDHYNEIAVTCQAARERWPNVILRARAYDDGVAFRCEFIPHDSMTNLVNLDESTEFRFDSDARCWAADYGSYVSHQEAKFEERRLSGLNPEGFIGLPLVVQISNDLYVVIAEAGLLNHAGMYLKRKNGGPGESVTLVNHTSGKVTTSLPHKAPWRMMMIARQPVKFLENDMLLNLNEPCALPDTEWIKPGMMAWDHWWSGDVKMDTATVKEYIQLAADMGWPYQLIDWQWYGDFDKPEADITKINPAVDMAEVLRFAKEKGVRCWLWLYWTDVERNDAYLKAFPLYEEWGIAGVKIDFMQRDDQWMVNWYEKIIRKAADHHLMVDFHGAYKPTGERRTLPNMVTREGVLGNEWNKWEPKVDPEHKCTLAFTRNLLGEMDFTPGGFRNRPRDRHAEGGGSARVPGTRAQELALFVVYESPVTCACDSPASYKDQPGADFLKVVPTTWDETLGLDGRIGDFVVVAKRKGADWYLGSMCDWDSRALMVPLDFLGDGTYEATLWRDATNANVNAESLTLETRLVTRDGVLPLYLASGGGSVVRLVPVKQTSTAVSAPSHWVAYNDLAWDFGQPTTGITAYSPAGSTQGGLIDFATGGATPVRLTLSGAASQLAAEGTPPPPTNSPADSVFFEKLDCRGYTRTDAGPITFRFDGMSEEVSYSFVLYGSRGAANYSNRWAEVSIAGAASFVNRSQGTKKNAKTARLTAANLDGSVIRFDQIRPGPDGSIEIVATPGGTESPCAYLNAFMLSRHGAQ